MEELERKFKQYRKKCNEILTRNCKWRARDGHTFTCDYIGTEVVRCNAVGREKCPLIRVLEEK